MVHELGDAAPFDAVQPRGDLEVAAGGELGVRERLLDDLADPRPRRGIRRPEPDAVDAHLAVVGPEHAEQHAHERRLAGAVESDDRVDLARGDAEVDAAEAGPAAEPAHEPATLEPQRRALARGHAADLDHVERPLDRVGEGAVLVVGPR